MAQKTFVLDVFAIAQREERADPGGYEWYVVAPGVLYTEMCAYVTQVIEDAVFVEADYQGYKAALTEIGVARMQELVCPLADVSPADRPVRYFVLETLRQWFTRLLKNSIGNPLGLHITKDDNWKL